MGEGEEEGREGGGEEGRGGGGKGMHIYTRVE